MEVEGNRRRRGGRGENTIVFLHFAWGSHSLLDCQERHHSTFFVLFSLSSRAQFTSLALLHAIRLDRPVTEGMNACSYSVRNMVNINSNDCAGDIAE